MNSTNFGEFCVTIECLEVESFAAGELDLRHERSADVDSLYSPWFLSLGAGVVFLERHFRVSKVNSCIALKPLDLFLACQVFALDVGAHLSQEFLFVVGLLEHVFLPVFGLMVFVGCLSAGVRKHKHSILTSFSGEDVGVVVRLGVGSSSGH